MAFLHIIWEFRAIAVFYLKKNSKKQDEKEQFDEKKLILLLSILNLILRQHAICV